MIKNRVLYILFFLLVSSSILAQNNCQEEIDRANKLYDDGIFREAEKITKTILDSCELNKTQKNEMLKLIASIYYEMDELELAEEYVAQFVKKNPNYIPSNKKDTHHFKIAYDKIKSWPRFSIGIRFGTSIAFPEALRIYPNLRGADYSKDYVAKVGLNGAIDFSWNINNFVALNTSPGYRSLIIQHEVPMYDNQLYFNYEEESQSLSMPVMVMGAIPFSDKIYLSLGVGGELSYFADGSYNYSYESGSGISGDISYYLDKNNSGSVKTVERSTIRYSALAAIRLSYRQEKFTFFIDGRYIKEFSEYTDVNYKYYNPDLYLLNNYTIADLQVSNFDLSIGILYNFSYKVKSKY